MSLLKPRVFPEMAHWMKELEKYGAGKLPPSPVLYKLSNRGWIVKIRGMHILSHEGRNALNTWRENKRKNYRTIALHNAIYYDSDECSHRACYFRDVSKLPPDVDPMTDLDPDIILMMIKSGELLFDEADGYWYAEPIKTTFQELN